MAYKHTATMADAHANANSTSTAFDSSATVYYDDNSLNLDQYLSYNAANKTFNWNGILEDNETFIDTRLTRSIDDGGGSDIS